MELKLTLLDPSRVAARVDVLIEAPVGTLFASVRDQLAAALGVAALGPEREFHCQGEPVDRSQPLGLPPLLQGMVLTLSSAQVHARASRSPALLELQVIAGPDAGNVVPLSIGRHTIGRSSENRLRLTDPDVSRAHAEMTVSATRVDVRDVGSANGSWIGDRRLGSDSEPLPPDRRLRIGTTLLAVRGPDRPPAAVTLDRAGHLRVNRAPQLRPTRGPVEICFPARPPDRPPAPLPWVTALIPLLLALPLAVFWKQPTFLLFGLMTPLMMATQHGVDRRSGRREAAGRQARHAAITTRRKQELEFAIIADAAYVEAAHPDLARLIGTASTPTDELWRRSSRDADFLSLRLGRGPGSSAIRVRRPTVGDSDHGSELDVEQIEHSDVPVAVDLSRVRVLGLCGPRRSVLGLARSLIGQICVLHSPTEVQVQVLIADPDRGADWHWTNWLPHTQDPGTPARSGESPDDGRYQVIVLDGARNLRRRSDLAAALALAAEPGSGRNGKRDSQASLPGPDPQDGRGEPVPDPGRAPLVICLDQVEPDLPVECGATVTLAATRASAPGEDPARTTGPGSAILRRTGEIGSRFVPDLAGERWAERLARDLAPLRDATPEPGSGLADTVRLSDLLIDVDRVRPMDSEDLARHWQYDAGRGPAATLGVTTAGPFRINLRSDGPHLLIGGTTGAGKSELLQTLVTALAVDSGPDAVSFLLIDYKGGAAFRECAELPHVAGVITDLDPALARRALTSLTAELRRRERLLRSAEAADIDSYRSLRAAGLGQPGRPPMPRLVVIVDEFRVLSEDLPEFVSGLVRTATVGRSLGVHLVLATQRPTGAVSADMSANLNLRIALRVNDGNDSRDLIDDPAAAKLPVDRPGRALARCGGGPLIGFQTAVVSGRAGETEQRAPVVRPLDLGHRLAPASELRTATGRSTLSNGNGLPTGNRGAVSDRLGSTPATAGARGTSRRPATLPAPTLPSDVVRIAAAARSAAARIGLPPVHPPWVTPLPPVLQLADLLGQDLTSNSRAEAAPKEGRNGFRLPFALIDRPDEQRQEVLAWWLNGSQLAISGGPRSGRSTVLRSIAEAAGALTTGENLHIYGVDGAGALASLSAVPPVEAVIPVHDTERAQRLLRLLAAEIETRQAADLRARPGPAIVLLIDGWEALTSNWGAVDHGRLVDELVAVLRDGPAVGVQAAISGGRGLLTGAVCTLLTERVLLRFADPADAVLAGVPSSRVLGSPAPGRGLVIGPRFAEALEIQVAVGRPTEPPSPRDGGDGRVERGWGEERNRLMGNALRPHHLVRPPVGRQTWKIPELPRRLEYHQLMAAELESGPWSPGWRSGSRSVVASRSGAGPAETPQEDRGRCVPVGIGGDEASVLGLDLDAAPITLVVGPAGSGRTSALRCIAAGLRQLGEPVSWVSLAGDGGAPDEHPAGEIHARDPQAAHRLAAILTSHPRSTVLVDNTQQTGMAGAARESLEDLLATRARAGRLVIASSAPELLSAYRGLLAIARPARSGVLLRPAEPSDAEVFGLRSERRPPGPPGRALLVQGGRTVTVQLTLPPPPELLTRCTPPEEAVPSRSAERQAPPVHAPTSQTEQTEQTATPDPAAALALASRWTEIQPSPSIGDANAGRDPYTGSNPAPQPTGRPPPRAESMPPRRSDEKVKA